jgi:Caspase domain
MQQSRKRLRHGRPYLAALLGASLQLSTMPPASVAAEPVSRRQPRGMRIERVSELRAAPARLASASPAALHAVRRYRKRIAVTIGINAYRSDWPALRLAVSDAERMRDLFLAMGFDEVLHIPEAEATRQRILNALERELPLRVEEQDLVVVYFAGHGATTSGMSHLAAVDSTRNLERTGISIEHLKEVSLRLKSLHVLYLMDACFSGNMLRRSKATQANSLAFWEANAKDRAVQLITAGRENELAVELDGWGLFTRALHDGLQGAADLNGDGVVTVPELGAHANNDVAEQSDDKQRPQWGSLEGAGTALLVHELRLPPSARPRRAPGTSSSAAAASPLVAARRLLNQRAFDKAEALLRKELLRDGLSSDDELDVRLLLVEVYLEKDPLGYARMIDDELQRVSNGAPSTYQAIREQDLRARLRAERNEK